MMLALFKGRSAEKQRFYGRIYVYLCLSVSSFFLIGAVTAVTSARAQGGQFTAVAEPVFGQKIQFTLTAVTDLPVTQTTLYIQPDATMELYSADLLFTADEANPRQFVATFPFDPKSVRFPPFTDISYWWEVETEDGETISVPAKTAVYADERFVWQIGQTDFVQFHWPGDDIAVGEAAIAVYERTWPELQALLPVSEEKVPVYIYPSSADLRTAYSLNGRDWQQGMVDPSAGAVMVTAVNPNSAEDDLSQSLPNGLAKMLLYRSAGRVNYMNIPFWFKEGLPLWFAAEAELAAEEAEWLAAAVLNNSTYSLLDLCTLPVTEADQLAYLQSESIVTFIHGRYGEQAVAELAAEFAQGVDCATAVETVLGQSLAELEVAWKNGQKPQPTWLQFARQNVVWILLILGGFVMMGLLVWQPRWR